MKKNTMMRAAGALLVAVLLTTSIISGTFAKYVTTGEVADKARVAMFGVVVNGSGTLFDENYYTVGNEFGNDFKDDSNQPSGDQEDLLNGTFITVESSNGDKVVAPGTKNDSGLTLSVTGTPEVDVRVTFDLTVNDEIFLNQGNLTELPDLTKDAYMNKDGEMASNNIFKMTGTYYPIRFTLTGDIVEANMADIKTALKGKLNVNYDTNSVTGTLDNIKTVLGVINGNDGIYVNANTDLADVQNNGIGDLNLTWEWAFEGSSVNRVVNSSGGVVLANAAQIDKMDTLLGDLAAGEVAGLDYYDDEYNVQRTAKYDLNVDLALTVTVTQVD